MVRNRSVRAAFPAEHRAEAVLGAILLDNRALDRANEIVQADDFYRSESHRRIFRAERPRRPPRARRRDHARRVPKRRGDLEAVGGARRSPSSSSARRPPRTSTSRAQIVKDKAVLRALMEASTDIAQRAADGAGDVSEFLDDAERMIFEISQRKIRQPYAKIESIIVHSIKQIETLYREEGGRHRRADRLLRARPHDVGLQPST